MATLTAPVPPILKLASSLGAACGQAVGYVAANAGGDFFPCSGQGILLTFKSAGTAATITLDSTILSSYGVDLNPTVVLASTDEQQVFVKNDLRFDAGGANTGLIAVTYSQVVTITVRAVTIPGLT